MSILKRQILYPGKRDLGELEPETKILYHFKTVVLHKNGSPNSIVIDDSREMAKDKPVETIYGKQFKLPIWESCLKSMRTGEICKLVVRDDPVTHYICLNYVITSKCFRKYYGVEPTNTGELEVKPDGKRKSSCKKENGHHDHHHKHRTENTSAASHSSHNCSMSVRNSPYTDLNELISNPPEIFEFTFELIDAIPPKSYTKEIWQMSDDEKLSILPKFREDGNESYKQADYDKAISFYSKGLSAIESLMLKEKPGDDDWKRLDVLKKPFLLNMAQAKLCNDEYYDCIKFADEVLKRDPENVKALLRRAKAHSHLWNINEARADLIKCASYDATMSDYVSRGLLELKQRENIKNKEDRERYGNMFKK